MKLWKENRIVLRSTLYNWKFYGTKGSGFTNVQMSKITIFYLNNITTDVADPWINEEEFRANERCLIIYLYNIFCFPGRFCSQRCVGAYASKRRAQTIHQLQLERGERPASKNTTPSSNKKPHGNSKRKKSEVLKVNTWQHLYSIYNFPNRPNL